jgi:hypothetical protein
MAPLLVLLALAVEAPPENCLQGSLDVQAVRVPTGLELESVAPRRTELADGKVSLTCEIAPDGTLDHCTAVDEVARLQGWAQSALDMAKFFRFETVARDGASAVGRCIRIPLTFEMD